jgi:transcriptional regulator with XRE-family HTH domain
MTQQQLGAELGITAQQIQNYETGANGISASHMRDIAAAMEVPVSFFFEGLARALGDAACPARRQEVPKISPPAEALSSNDLSLPKIFHTGRLW